MSLFGVDAGIVAGYPDARDKEELTESLVGHGFDVMASQLVFFGLYSSSGQSMMGPDFPNWEIGVSTPGLGVGYTYSWLLGNE